MNYHRESMKLHIAIVDDESEAISNLSSLILRYGKENHLDFEISSFQHPEDFLKEDLFSFDLLFLDIEFKGEKRNGMDLAKQIRAKNSNLLLIFVTNMAQFALSGYEVDALDFIVKPLNYYSFAMKMQKAVRVLSTRAKKEAVLIPLSHDVSLLSDRIYYVEVVNHDLYYHSLDGEFHTRDTMKHVEELVKGLPFSRCNVCYLVNLDMVVGIDKNEVILKNGDHLSMPRSRKKEFLDDLNRYIGGGYIA